MADILPVLNLDEFIVVSGLAVPELAVPGLAVPVPAAPELVVSVCVAD